MCLSCNTRRQRSGSVLCEPCRFIHTAEGTRRLYETLRLEKHAEHRRKTVDRYRRMVAKGVPTAEMVQRLGFENRQAMSRFLWKARQYGFQVPYLPRNPIVNVGLPATESKGKLGHGEGTGGIYKCKCDLCSAKRREYKKLWRRNQRAQGRKNP